MHSSGKSTARDRRGAKAREEMRNRGYIQTYELAEKLTAELGEPGSLPMIQYKIERLDERAEKLEKIMEDANKEREEMTDIMREGQKKTDSLMQLLIEERQRNNKKDPNGQL